MTTRIGNASDFQAAGPMMRQHRARQQQIEPEMYTLHPDAEQRFRRWIGEMAEDPRSLLVVAEDQGRIIGFLYTTMEADAPIYLPDRFALVREWWVDPTFRGQDAGKALLDRAAAELAAMGVAQIRARAAAADEDVNAVLEDCGFRPGATEFVKQLQVKG